MLMHENTSSILRFYKNPKATEEDQYDAVCTVLWLTKKEIELIGLHGNMNLSLYDDLLKWCLDNNIETIRAERRNGHIMPGVKKNDGFYYLNVASIAKKRNLFDLQEKHNG